MEAASRSELAGGERSEVVADRHGCSEKSSRGNTGCHGNSSDRSQVSFLPGVPVTGVGRFGGGGRQWERKSLR